MAFVTPKMADLIEQLRVDIEVNLPGADAHLRRSNLNVLAIVMGGGLHGVYGALEVMAANLLPDTGDDETVLRWARLWSLNQKSASKASGSVVVTCEVDTVIPTGSLLIRRDGVQFEVINEMTATEESITVPVRATVAGSDGNTIANTQLSWVVPVVGADPVTLVDVTTPITGGTDDESIESLRSRVIKAIQSPAMAGTETDYLTWALAVTGVTRAWVFPGWLGLGTVGITVAADAQDDPTPSDELVASVQDTLTARAPVTAQPIVFKPFRTALNPHIWLNPDTEEVRASVEAELQELLRRDVSVGGTLLLSHLEEAISIATGEVDHVLVFPAANITLTTSELLVLGEVTWLTTI